MIATAQIKQALARSHCMGKRIAHLWGQRYMIQPTFVKTIFGDGLKPMWLEDMDNRPEYYVIMADSKWGTDNSDPDPFCDHLEEVIEAIRNQFGDAYEEWDHENGRTYRRRNPWPAANFSSGCSCWGELEMGLTL